MKLKYFAGFVGPMLALPLLAAGPQSNRLKMFAPLPPAMDSRSNPGTAEKVALGRMLYFETRVSKNGKLSCNSCHGLGTYGVDNQPTSTGHNNQKGGRNSPTVYNAAGHFVQFWDGRAGTVEDQAKGPVLNPVEMAMASDKDVVANLKRIPGYVTAFKAAFPGEADPVTFDNFAKAIGAFERKLVTPGRWDRYLRGEEAALTAAEKAGFDQFVNAGCASCHMGAYLGGVSYQKLGVAKQYPDQKDQGRFAVTKSEGDRMLFKVPSLRNIEKTGPYFHHGKVATLDEAVKQMGEFELGKKLSAGETQSIVSFLRALTGELPATYVKAPKLP